MSAEKLPDSIAQMQDILDIEDVIRSPWDDFIRWMIGILIIAASIYLIYRFIQYIRKRFFPNEENIPPYQRALRDLKILKGRQYPERSEWAGFYFELSEILKRYLSDRLQTGILDMTTEEILRLKNRHVPPLEEGEWESLKKFLTESDLVKFAKLPATAAQTEEDFVFIQKLVKSVDDRTDKKTARETQV